MATNCFGCDRPRAACTCNGHDYTDRGAHCTCNDEAVSDLSAERSAHAETRARLAACERVVEAARALRDSGYDGPMMGDEVAPLFAALAALDGESRAHAPEESLMDYMAGRP